MNYNLASIFELVADIHPDRTALIAGDTSYTYAELDERANRLANHLLANGIGTDDKVGIYAYNRSEWIESLFACFKIRAVPININYRYVEDELFYLFDNADLKALIFERDMTPVVAKLKPRLNKLEHYIAIDDRSDVDTTALNAFDYEASLASASGTRPNIQRTSDDTYMLYTGGTTGLPKGVVWRHEDIFHAALNHGEPFDSEAAFISQIEANQHPMITFSTAPMMHALGKWAAMLSFFAGGTFVLYDKRRFDPLEIWQVVEKERANILLCVGDAMARPLVDSLRDNKDSLDIESLFAIGSGGAILSEAVKGEFKALLPNVVIYNSFGSSETGSTMSMADAESEADDRGPECILGDHNQVFDDDMNPVPEGSGEVGVLAKTGYIPLAYYKDAEKTAATFRHDKDGNRWVIMGDFVRMETDGSARFLGRGSVCINSGGEKIYPEEVETVLKGHPDIFDVAVVGVPHERFTEAVAAVITTRNGTEISSQSINDYCVDKLARYKVPKHLIFVDAVTRTASAKPDYRALKTLATERVQASLVQAIAEK